MAQLLLPESTELLRFNNTSKMVCDKSGTKFYPVSQGEMELYFSYLYAPADQVKIDEVVSNTFHHPNSGWIMGYDPVSKKPSITTIFASCRREMSEREFHRQVMNTAIYYDGPFEEENAENMEKARQRIKDAGKKLLQKDHVAFAVRPVSAELSQKLRDYFDEYNDAWRSIRIRNGF